MNRGDAGWRLEWRLRGYDLAILLKLLRPRRRRVLDVGAWNGWLSHRLSLQGCEVTAVDYFADEHDGLGARKFYSTNWRAIQIDLTDLSVLDECFDIIVLNRCLQFFPDPLTCVRAACQMLSPGGRLIATGLQFYQDPSHKARQVAETRQSYQERYGFELFLRPTKAYLDFDDMKDLEAAGLALKPYPQLRLANLKAAFKRAQPRHLYGVYEAGGSEPGR
jgi:2-polyprenyl-3-methyl-5-hydroxy-6-metoxy-1,4-benzoquinol methylase